MDNNLNDFEKEILEDDSLDFEMIPPAYAVSLIGFDEDDKYSGYNTNLGNFIKQADAENFARQYKLNIPTDISESTVYFRVEVNKEIGDNYSELIFSKVLLLN